jgi:hypothetical protein
MGDIRHDNVNRSLIIILPSLPHTHTQNEKWEPKPIDGSHQNKDFFHFLHFFCKRFITSVNAFLLNDLESFKFPSIWVNCLWRGCRPQSFTQWSHTQRNRGPMLWFYKFFRLKFLSKGWSFNSKCCLILQRIYYIYVTPFFKKNLNENVTANGCSIQSKCQPGWPDWANFRLLGTSLLQKEPKHLGYFIMQ